MNKFTTKQKQELKKLGYTIFTLTGKSMKDLKKDGFKFWSTWHEGKDLENIKSSKGEIAIKVDEDVVPGSTNKTYAETEILAKELSKSLPKGTRATIASHADYLEVWYQYAKKTGKPLFTKDRWIYTWTNTEYRGSGDSFRLIAGNSDGGGAALVDWRHPANPLGDVGWRAAVVCSSDSSDLLETPALESLGKSKNIVKEKKRKFKKVIKEYKAENTLKLPIDDLIQSTKDLIKQKKNELEKLEKIVELLEEV